jgi:hypothetical protein
MAEVNEPALQRKVLALCIKLAEVDDHVAEGESIVLSAAMAHWRLSVQTLSTADDAGIGTLRARRTKKAFSSTMSTGHGFSGTLQIHDSAQGRAISPWLHFIEVGCSGEGATGFSC